MKKWMQFCIVLTNVLNWMKMEISLNLVNEKGQYDGKVIVIS